MIPWCPVENPMVDGSQPYPAEEPEGFDDDLEYA